MFVFTFMIVSILRVSGKTFDYVVESGEDPIVYYDDDASQDSGDLYLGHNYRYTSAETSTPTRQVKNSTKETSKYRGGRNAVETSDKDPQTLVDYPYVASITRRGSHYATAALIDKRWLISVAAEFFNVRESIKQLKAVLGSVNCKKGTSIPLLRIEVHPSFVPGRPAYDVALLLLAWPVQAAPDFKPVPLATTAGKVASAKYLTAYWPRIIVKERVLPTDAPERMHYNSLRVSTQTLIPADECAALMRGVNESLHHSLLCLNPVTEFHTKCMPDAGAPVVAAAVLWGVTSGWSPPACASSPRSTPTLFTRLASYTVKGWIQATILTL